MITINKTFAEGIATGDVQGYELIDKFGENPDVDTAAAEDLWDFGGIYVFSETNDIDRLSSSDNSDDQDIKIEGLDLNYFPVTQTVTLNGQTPVALDKPLLRVFRMINVGATDIAGDVYCFVNSAVTLGIPDDDSKVRAVIKNGNNQTLMMIYTVPANRTLYYLQGFIAISRAQVTTSADFTLRTRVPGGIFQVKRRISLVSQGSSHWIADYPSPRVIPSKTDIVFRCDAVSANNTGVSGGFSGYLKII